MAAQLGLGDNVRVDIQALPRNSHHQPVRGETSMAQMRLTLTSTRSSPNGGKLIAGFKPTALNVLLCKVTLKLNGRLFMNTLAFSNVFTTQVAFIGGEDLEENGVYSQRITVFTLYTGKDAQFIIKFQKIKGSRTYGIRPQVRVLVAFKPNYLKSETQQLLTGVFFTDKKDDCSFFEKMGLHEQILMGMALVAALVIIPLIAFVIFRWKRDEKKMRKRRGTKKNTPCYVWFFKCDQTSSHEAYNYRYEEESELNDRAQNGRAHNGHAHNDHAHNGRAHNGHLHNGHV
eukprot:gene4755-5379_t